MELLLVAAAVVAGAVAGWAGWRRRKRTRVPAVRVDPFTLTEPWRRHVAAAQSAQRRYRELASGARSGPLRDRLDAIGGQVQLAVEEAYAVARRGDELDRALARLDVAALDRQLQLTTDEVARTSIAAQLAAAGRLRTARDGADTRLRLEVTRMGELTALAAEVAVGTATEELPGTDALRSGVDEVVTQLEGLRLALQELEQPGRPSTSP